MVKQLKCWIKEREPKFNIHLPYSETFKSQKGDVIDIFKTYNFTKVVVYVSPHKGKTHKIFEGYNKSEALKVAKSYMKNNDKC